MKDIHGKLALADFGDYSFRLPEEKPKIIIVKNNILTPVQKENKRLKLENKDLESQLMILRKQHEDIIEKWRSGLMKIYDLEKEKVEMVESYAQKVK